MIICIMAILSKTATDSERDEFKIMYARCYEQTIGVQPGENLDISNKYIAVFVRNLDKTANSIWAEMNKSYNSERTEIFPNIKPQMDSEQNSATADLTTTFTYLNNLAKAYATQGTKLYQNKQVPKEIFSAIDFMLDNDWYGNTTYDPYGNWWDHQIGVPAQFLPIMIILYDEISDSRFTRYIAAMKNQLADNWEGWEAANQADISLNAIYMGILTEDDKLLSRVKAELGLSMFEYSSGNGWHEDGSYIDHDVFSYTGGYGSVLITAMEKIMPLVAGTNYDLTYGDERDTFYDDIIFNNYIPVHHSGRLLDMVCGRSITRSTNQERQSAGQLAVFAGVLSTEKGSQLRSIVKKWLLDDPSIMDKITKPAPLTACIKILEDDSIQPSDIPEGFYRFSDMDKYVQHNSNYTVALSMHSDTIANYEFINEEGAKMWNTADGALFINNADMNQYKDNYWVTVNHLRMPGVTTLFDAERRNNAGHNSHNPNSMVGGVDMGNIGIAAMQISTIGNGDNRDGLFAKKSYFMFDDEIVLLGSDIHALSNTGLPAETIVENRKIETNLSNRLTFNGKEIDVIDNSTTQLRKGEKISKVKWAHLEGNVSGSDIGYYFPAATDLLAVKNTRTGAWEEINSLKSWGHKDLPSYTRGYAEIVIDHGILPMEGNSADYSYVLLPGKSEEETREYNETPDIDVLKNTEEVHAVRENTLGVTAVNFWTDKPAEAGGILSNQPASIMWKDTESTFELVVCDPTHRGTAPITLAITGAKISSVISKDDKITVNSNAGENILKLTIDTEGTKRAQQYRAVFEKY